jgi:hypothetical protein
MEKPMKPLHRTSGVAIVLIGVLGWFSTRPSKPTTESNPTMENSEPSPKEVPKKRTKQTHQTRAQTPDQGDLNDTNQPEPPLTHPPDKGPEANFDEPENIDPSQSVWSLTKEGIDGAIREIMTDIQDCYQTALTDIPDLEGGLMVNFTVSDVDGLGQVTKIGIRDSRSKTAPQLVDEPFENCVMDHFETLQFDAPGSGGETIIHYPFQFRPD